MFMRESWVIPFVKKNGPDVKFGVVPVPRDKAFGAFNAVEVLSVNKDSKLKEAAWDFVRILQDLRADTGVLLIAQVYGIARLGFDEHLMPARGQLADGGRRHPDAIFVILDFLGHADAHDFLEEQMDGAD